MPVCQCASRMGMLAESMKADIATAITDAHLEATGALREFVHVFFIELPQGAVDSAGELDTKVSTMTGARNQLLAGLTELDPDVIMEYGLFLPYPGGEAEWFTTNKDALHGIQGTGLSHLRHSRHGFTPLPSSTPRPPSGSGSVATSPGGRP